VETLKREAGTDWFWNMSAEWAEIAGIFGVTYIYYIEKINGEYRFLMSSSINREEHPEWLGTPVWQGEPPAYVEAAYAAKEPRISPAPTVNEWGTLLGVVLPVLAGGEVAGILGTAYDMAFVKNSYADYELRLAERQNAQERSLLTLLILSIVFTFLVMGGQILLSYRSVLVPLRVMEADMRIRLMMDATPLICGLWDSGGNMVDCNREALNIFGLAEKPDYLEHFFEFNPEYQPDGERTREKTARLIKAAFETGYQRFEWMFHTAAGEPLPTETILVRLPWEKGFRLASYSRDLREIKAREAAEREVEERLRVMLDTMAFAAFFFDASGSPVDCNQRALALYGCQNKEEFLSDFFSFSPEFQPDGSRSIEKAKELIHKALKTGKEVFKWEHRKADRTPLPTEITLIRVGWGTGFRLVAYARDLTSLRETEDNLRRILSVVEGSPNFILFISADGDIEYMNPAVSYVTGLSKAELLNDGLERMFSPDDFQRLGAEYLAVVFENRRMVNFEMGVFDKKGRRRDYAFSAFSARLHGGMAGVGILGRDITEIKRIQRDLIAAKEQAEQALAQGAYYHQAKNDFLSRVSHEMRTPMNVIIGMTGIAQKAPTEQVRSQSLDKIKSASKRLLGIVNDILDITDLDSGGFAWNPRPFSFDRAMGRIIDSISAKAAVKQQRFIPDIDWRIPDRLVSDERRLRQILSKLLSNAVKFTAEGGDIGLSAALIEDRGEECLVRFEVSDTGVGIPPEAQERLWDVFEQEDNSITRKHGGMGLGLPLTRRLVELMKGSIRLESVPGKGSRFICEVRLGCERVLPDAELPAGELPDADLPVIPDLKDLRFLVVDDVNINREVLFALLEEAGAAYDGANNGADAISMFSQTKYDMVLMDLHMPVMNGFDAARAIRGSGQPWANTTPIISVSADTSADLHSKCLAAGINGHIAKPVDADILFQEIRKWLPTRPPRPGAPEIT
jgi:PAS domain S-box-containing protein